MVADIEAARQLCEVSDDAAKLLGWADQADCPAAPDELTPPWPPAWLKA